MSFAKRLFFTGEMKIPQAVIIGYSELQFEIEIEDSEETVVGAGLGAMRGREWGKWRLTRQTETVNFAKSINSGTLMNRRLARDVLEFLDALRPAIIGI